MGLNMAIVDPGALPLYNSIEAQTKKLCEEAVLDASPDGGHLQRLEAYGAYLAGGAAEAEAGAGFHSLLQADIRRSGRRSPPCPGTPQLDGEDLDQVIADTKGVLVVAIPGMRCTEAAVAALTTGGVAYTLKEFHGPFAYQAGESAVWDWLHCKYHDDREGSLVMHSYVFLDGAFVGQGFRAADKAKAGVLGAQSCDSSFPREAEVLHGYMNNASNRVLLFGWINCPCVGIAQGRFAAASLCYAGRQWAEPDSRLMAYLQCRERDAASHSFIYFRNGTSPSSEWTFAGNGFAFADSAMTQAELTGKAQQAGAQTDCRAPSIQVNVYGTQLEECRVAADDVQGSWMDDGTCSEQTGGVHQICIESLPADFSSETHQSPWSREREGRRHCVCVGAWSLYMTDAAQHAEGAADIMPHCKAIPETALTARYLANWRDWNGYPASVVHGVGELIERCLAQATDEHLKCGLKKRFDQLKSSPEAAELKDAEELQGLAANLSALSCAHEA
mmetsp:Transcript_61576/g.191165  ORF Transcript_61576/g.191165 Transcript_61576/m.191165 type:complete len:503 (-) Transcript_61576:207-1715(-)